MASNGRRKEAVIVIVEGYSDRDALDGILRQLYKNKNHAFAFAMGDITSDEDSNPDNIEEKTYMLAKTASDNKKWNLDRDVSYIVYLVDMDGAFIPESIIVYRNNSKVQYTSELIEAKDVNGIKERNRRKAENIRKLVGLSHLKSVPYEIYFMSRNLDHALYNIPDLEQCEKTGKAYEFAKRFKDKERTFITFLSEEVANGVPANMAESWKYIFSDTESLKRHTNFFLYFISHPVL